MKICVIIPFGNWPELQNFSLFQNCGQILTIQKLVVIGPIWKVGVMIVLKRLLTLWRLGFGELSSQRKQRWKSAGLLDRRLLSGIMISLLCLSSVFGRSESWKWMEFRMCRNFCFFDGKWNSINSIWVSVHFLAFLHSLNFSWHYSLSLLVWLGMRLVPQFDPQDLPLFGWSMPLLHRIA